MAERFLDNAMRSNRLLFSLIYRFNCQPALDVHPDHLADFVDEGLFDRVVRSPAAERRLSDCVTRRFELEPDGHWDFEDQPLRLALLDRQRLYQLVLMTSAAVWHRSISRIIQREHLQELTQLLGESVYLFAVKRAPFLMGTLAEEAVTPIPAQDQDRWLTEAGWKYVHGCISPCPAPVQQRLRLKLPKSFDTNSQQSLSTEQRDSAFQVVKRILLDEIEPGLAPCFN